MKKNPGRSLGRPRSFDCETALNAATQVFWSRGYGDASLDDLTSAMGIARPSLYSAFGDKQSLYLICIDRYAQWVRGAVGDALADHAGPRTSLMRMFAEGIALYTMPLPEPRGCLLASASLSEAALSPLARESISAALAGIEGVVRDFFRRMDMTAPRAGECARLVVTFLYGVSGRARLGVPAATLTEDAERFAALVLNDIRARG